MEHQKKQGESQENMQENYMGENDIEKSIEEQEQNVKAQNMENTQNKDNKKETKNKKEGRRKKKRRLVFL